MMKCITSAFIFLFVIQTGIPQTYKLKYEDEQFLDTLQYRTYLYFINEINPQNNLVKDRSADWSPASIAATGFGVAVWVVGVDRGWMTRDEAINRILNLLNFLISSDQRGDTNSTGYHGLYYHFLDLKTGKRVWQSELSTIDTGLLLAGLRLAFQYFNKNNTNEIAIRTSIDSLTKRINWDWLTEKNGVEEKYNGSISMGWTPEEGIHRWGWVGYNEALILYILAAGSGYKDAVPAYNVWLKNYKWAEPYPGLAHAVYPPLFVHQYSQAFVDFRGIQDKYMLEKGIDYFENSRRAVLTQRKYAIDNPNGWKGYDSLTWGLTACDGPGEKYNYDNKRFHSYAGRGTSGPGLSHDDDGTIAPTAVGGSFPFTPEIVLQALKSMYNEYGKRGLWGKYGFKDSFNPTLNWFAPDFLGIDEGPIVIMTENFRSGLIWNYMMKDPVIQKGLQILGFVRK
jgi:hypothetical protein